MANLGRLFDPSPHHSKENGEIFVFSFLQPTKSRKISYREQQELLRISLEEHPDFNKEGIILDTIEKGGEIYWVLRQMATEQMSNQQLPPFFNFASISFFMKFEILFFWGQMSVFGCCQLSCWQLSYIQFTVQGVEICHF